MAYPLPIKAQVMAMLLTGDTVSYIAKQLGLPKQTVSRWRAESDLLLRQIVRSSPKLQAALRSLRGL